MESFKSREFLPRFLDLQAMLLDIQVFQLDCFATNMKALRPLRPSVNIYHPERYNPRRLESLGEFLDRLIRQ
jgi:hypothetical protein